MSAVFAIANISIHDTNRYDEYSSSFLDIFSDYDAKLVGFAEPPEVLEGEFTGTRLVVLEFASREELDRWYTSDAYQEILKHRLASSKGDIWIVPKI